MLNKLPIEYDNEKLLIEYDNGKEDAMQGKYGSSRIFLAHGFTSQSRDEAKQGQRGREEAGTHWRMFFPQAAQSPAKAVERCLSILAPLSGSVAFESQEIRFDLGKGILQEREEKSRDQRDQSQQLERMFPDAQARAFQRQFTFARAKCRFKRPSAARGEKDLPGLLIAADALIGDQTHTMLARTDFDHRELSGITAMRHRCPPQITGDLDLRFHVFPQLLGEIFLACPQLIPRANACRCPSRVWLVVH